MKRTMLVVGMVCLLMNNPVSGEVKSGKPYLAGKSADDAVGASVVGLSGVVSDDKGQSIRGAVITVAAGNRTMSRFSDNSGRYKIGSLKAGTYTISATAYGFERKESTTKLSMNVVRNFALAANWDPHRLSTADWLTFLPKTQEITQLTARCSGCHNLSNVVNHLGSSTEEFQAVLGTMGTGVADLPAGMQRTAVQQAPTLEKYFGTNAPLPTREQVNHVGISDGALNSTVWEYAPPTRSWIHTVTVDPVRGQVWFGQMNAKANSFGQLDIATEKITEYKAPTPESYPHSMVVAPDGRVYFTFSNTSKSPRIATWDPATKQIKEIPNASGHTADMDYEGNVWFSGGATGASKYDPRTGKYQRFLLPIRVEDTTVPDVPLEDAEAQNTPSCYSYDVAVDGQDNVWITSECGYIAKLDAKTGKVLKTYPVPNTNIGGSTFGLMKGIAASPDAIWFSLYRAHKLGRLDPETGEIKLFSAPSPYSSPYGIFVDRYNGKIWYSDFFGSRLTRFDPKTEEFTEFTLPNPDEEARFMGQDAQGRIWYADWHGKVGCLDPGDQPAKLQVTIRKPATR